MLNIYDSLNLEPDSQANSQNVTGVATIYAHKKHFRTFVNQTYGIILSEVTFT